MSLKADRTKFSNKNIVNYVCNQSNYQAQKKKLFKQIEKTKVTECRTVKKKKGKYFLE